MTRLETFIQANRIDVAELMRLAEISERYLTRIRSDQTMPRRYAMERIAEACSWLAARHVDVSELFDA